MRLIGYLFPATLLMGIALLATPSHLSSQEPVSGSQQPNAQLGSMSGTVTAASNEVVPGATVVLEGPAPTDHRKVVADDNGSFNFSDLKPDVSYNVTISANGFVNWTSPDIILEPGQFLFLKDISLEIAGGVTSVTVVSSPEQIAVEQVHLAEQQRVLGIIPNFYVVYDANPAPLSTRLKFSLAFKFGVDPITFLGAAIHAGINQAGDTPDYVQGVKGYGQRFGAAYTDDFIDILFGGAILPSLLHQDPRYYYQGTGTPKSRARHALSYAFVCRGDNGRLQPNYSTIGGDLASALISIAYYPDSDRTLGMVLQSFLVNTGERMTSSLVQEFVLRRFTHRANHQN